MNYWVEFQKGLGGRLTLGWKTCFPKQILKESVQGSKLSSSDFIVPPKMTSNICRIMKIYRTPKRKLYNISCLKVTTCAEEPGLRSTLKREVSQLDLSQDAATNKYRHHKSDTSVFLCVNKNPTWVTQSYWDFYLPESGTKYSGKN